MLKNTLGSTSKNKEIIESTYKPQINDKKASKRSIDKFIKDQESFV